jgi:D-inositol-3-phosphate glycosyltransferase
MTKMRKGSPNIAVLTAGGDKPYALGLAGALIDAGIGFEFLGSDEVDSPELHGNPLVVLRNFRGNQDTAATLLKKVSRVLVYYVRLLAYAVYAKPRIFHILWNNKIEWFDRTVLMLLYRLCGRRIVFTAHNVNAAARDGKDGFLNRLTLRIQYRLADHILVHTDRMRREMHDQFKVPLHKIDVIPFGMNSTVPYTSLTNAEARRRIGVNPGDRVVLFFGNIAPYKGLEYLVEAMTRLPKDQRYRLLIAGFPKNCPRYWETLYSKIEQASLDCSITTRIEYVPDEDTEVYFKAADALVLPYTFIFQSGVLFLGYNFGLPVLAADVGSLREDIVEGKTGFMFRAADPEDLALTIERYFESDLYRQLAVHRSSIRTFASERYSWSRVASITQNVYARLLTSVTVKPLESSESAPVGDLRVDRKPRAE